MVGNTKTYVFFLSGEEISIALEEIKSLFGVEAKLLFDRYYFMDFDMGEEKVKNISKRLAYTKAALVKRSSSKSLETFDKEVIKNSYKINHSVLKDYNLTTREIADLVYLKLEKPEVDVNNPSHEYVFLQIEKEILLLEFLFVNKDKIDDRRAHKKERNHPTSMSPKLAKAMINLSGANSFIDPFCGAGGLLIEGKLMGLDVKGSDISKDMIDRARQNSKNLGLEISLEVKDALKLNEKTSAIVTDFPYGRNSTVSGEINKLYSDFFKIAQNLTSVMVVGMMSTTNYKDVIEGTKWKVKKEFEIYVHKSLTRKILVLKT